LTHCFSFFLTRPLTPHIYTLSLHDALPISVCQRWPGSHAYLFTGVTRGFDPGPGAGANAFIHGLAGDQFGKSVGIAGAADLHIRSGNVFAAAGQAGTADYTIAGSGDGDSYTRRRCAADFCVVASARVSSGLSALLASL